MRRRNYLIEGVSGAGKKAVGTGHPIPSSQPAARAKVDGRSKPGHDGGRLSLPPVEGFIVPQSLRHAVKVKLLPVAHSTSFSGISCLASSTKFAPLQCIGSTCSSWNLFNSAITWRR